MTTYIFSFTLQSVQLAVFAEPAVSPGEDLILSTAIYLTKEMNKEKS